jgi:hypothetical protein
MKNRTTKAPLLFQGGELCSVLIFMRTSFRKQVSNYLGDAKS